MFWKRKIDLSGLCQQLKGSVDVLEGDHDLLQDLKADVAALTIANRELVAKIATLESRQESLRGGLRAGLSEPSTPMFTDDFQSDD